MEQQFLTVYFLRQLTDNTLKIEISDDIVPIENKKEFNDFIYRLNRIPQEFELFKWLLQNNLYGETIKMLLLNPIEQMVYHKELENYFNGEDILLKKINSKVDYGELINFYLEFKTNKNKFTNYNSHLKQIYSKGNGTINIPEYKKFILINNLFKQMSFNENELNISLFKNENIIKLINYIQGKHNIYVTELPIFKHKDYTLSVSSFNFSTTEKFIDLIEENENEDFIIYTFESIESFTENFPNLFTLRMVKKNFQ